MWPGRSAPLSTSFRLGISLLEIRLVRRGADKLADRALTVNRFSLVSQPEVAGQGHCNAAVSCIGLLPLPVFHLQLDLSGTGSLSHCQLGPSLFAKPSSDIIVAAFFALFILSVRLGWPRLISSGLLDLCGLSRIQLLACSLGVGLSGGTTAGMKWNAMPGFLLHVVLATVESAPFPGAPGPIALDALRMSAGRTGHCGQTKKNPALAGF